MTIAQLVKSPVEGVPSLGLSLSDRHELHAHYMPFLKDAGLFVPTTEPFSLHQEIILQMRLAELGKRLTIPGRVVWLAPSQGQRQTEPGIGLQFTGEHRHKVKQFIEDVLGDLVKQTPAQTAY